MRVLFVGNSYTSRHRLPWRVADLAAAGVPPTVMQVDSLVAGGASLRGHWNAGTARQAIERGGWDWVVLQEQSTLPVKNPQRYHENVRLFANPIAEHGARIALYLTWSRQHAPQTQEALTDAVERIAPEVDALIVPVGPAWHTVLQQDRGVVLYDDDGSHPTAAGSFLAACVFHAALFGAAPRGGEVARALGVEADTARWLGDAAWSVCSARAAQRAGCSPGNVQRRCSNSSFGQ